MRPSSFRITVKVQCEHVVSLTTNLKVLAECREQLTAIIELSVCL